MPSQREKERGREQECRGGGREGGESFTKYTDIEQTPEETVKFVCLFV